MKRIGYFLSCEEYAPEQLIEQARLAEEAGVMLVIEPLIHYSAESAMVPNLVTEIPSIENGMLAEDLSSVTFHLLPDVTWSDGEPFTAEDVVAS